MDITPYLRLLVEKQGSDLHFTVGAQVKLNVEGKLTSVGKTSLTAEMTQAAAYGVMKPEQAAGFERNWEADFAIALADGSGRFRVNVFSYGRNASHEAPPVQIRASGVTAHGSCLG